MNMFKQNSLEQVKLSAAPIPVQQRLVCLSLFFSLEWVSLQEQKNSGASLFLVLFAGLLYNASEKLKYFDVGAL